MKSSAAALLALLASSGCSAEADQTAALDGPVRVQTALPARPEGPVLDQADVLPASTEVALDQRLRQLHTKTGDALVVVTVDTLGGKTIDDYALALFSDWGIGDAATDRGLLILVAPNERQARIEVGCGLESTVTDDQASEIMQQRILPEFREGDFPAGVEAGVEALTARLMLPKPANDPSPHSELCKVEPGKAA